MSSQSAKYKLINDHWQYVEDTLCIHGVSERDISSACIAYRLAGVEAYDGVKPRNTRGWATISKHHYETAYAHFKKHREQGRATEKTAETAEKTAETVAPAKRMLSRCFW